MTLCVWEWAPLSRRKGSIDCEKCICAGNVEDNAADVLTLSYSLVVTLGAWAGSSLAAEDCISAQTMWRRMRRTC